MTQGADTRLAQRILAGEHEACVEFIALHHAPIYRLLVYLCRDVHAAEDLTQESFAAAWTNIAAFAGDSSLGTWLHQIAYRKFIDHRRRAGRAVPTANQAIDHVDCKSIDPLDAAMADDEARQLHRALDTLPAAERDLVVLHYLQGLTYQEIASVVNEPTGTVKWRTHKAIENLRGLLTGRHEHESGSTTTS